MFDQQLAHMEECIKQCQAGAITELECLAKLTELLKQTRLRYVGMMLADALSDLNI